MINKINEKTDLPQEAHNAKIKTEEIIKNMLIACRSLKAASESLKTAGDFSPPCRARLP